MTSPLLPIVIDVLSHPEKQTGGAVTCDDVFGLYLIDIARKVTQQGFGLVYIFLEKLRECLNETNQDPNYTQTEEATGLPDSANQFISEYLSGEDLSRDDAIGLMMHFCRWLFVKQYSHLKLSLCE